MTPEVNLWRSVIIQAILDALGLFSEPNYTNRKINRRAIEWMKEGDIELVCDYADMSPEYIRFIYNRLKLQKSLETQEIEVLLQNAFLRPRKFTVYSNEGAKK